MIVRRTAPAALSIGLFAALALGAGQALAQDRDPAAAHALFDSARELIRQGKFAEACPKFQESNRLDPGIGTEFHLADCYEQTGRVATAWAQFSRVASLARVSGQLDREKAATARVDKLEPRLPRLLVTVPESSKVAGLEIRRNGMVVGSAQWGVAVPVDPGEVELTASAPGKQSLHQTLRLEEGKTASYSLPTLVNDVSAPAPAPVTAAPAAVAPTASTVAPQPSPAPALPDSEKPRDTASGRRNTGIVLGLASVGVVGLGVSGVFAIMAKGKDSDSKKDSHCKSSNPKICDETGIGLRNDAIRDGNVATVAVIAGGAALAGAAVVWLLSGPSEPAHATAHPRVWATADVGSNRGAFYVLGSF